MIRVVSMMFCFAFAFWLVVLLLLFLLPVDLGVPLEQFQLLWWSVWAAMMTCHLVMSMLEESPNPRRPSGLVAVSAPP